VTLTPSAASVAVGSPVTITWHYSLSTAPSPGIPIANAATAKAQIVVGGAAGSTITAGPSAAFPPAPVATGGTFQIPDFRGTTDGWVLNATMSDLALTGGPYANSGAAPIPAGDVTASGLSCAGNPAGTLPYPSNPTAGSGGALSTTTAITLCSQAAGGTNPPTVTGGDFLVGAGLSLKVPAYVLQGTYTGTVTISLQ
jgi:hypothetical protein